MSQIATPTAAAQPLVALNLTAEQFETALESAACSLRTEISGGLKLDGAELLAAAEEQLSVEGFRAAGRRYLARAERPEFAHNAAELKAIGEEKMAEAEELGEFYAEAIGLYRALLQQSGRLVAADGVAPLEAEDLDYMIENEEDFLHNITLDLGELRGVELLDAAERAVVVDDDAQLRRSVRILRWALAARGA